MISRRALLAGGVAALAAPPIRARAQTPTDSGAAAPTILRLERRDIEVNGKTASVYGIRQPNGTFGLTTEVGKPFRVRSKTASAKPSLIHWHGTDAAVAAGRRAGDFRTADSAGRQR